MENVICKCGTVMFINGQLAGAFDARDFRRFAKTGKCPFCR